MAVVRKLTLSLCCLALSVLLLAFFLQPLRAKQTSYSFFSRAYGLVVVALSTAWVVGRDAAGGRNCIRANLADGVGGILLSCCLLLSGITFSLHTTLAMWYPSVCS